MAASKRPSRSGQAPGRITDVLPTGEMIEPARHDEPDFGRSAFGSSAFRSTLSQAEHRDRQERGLEADQPAGQTPAKGKVKKASRQIRADSARPLGSAPRQKPMQPSSGPAQMRLADAIASAQSEVARDILWEAGGRAIRRDGEAVASVGLMLILQGAVAVGLTMEAEQRSTPRWLVDFALAQGVSSSVILSYGGTARLDSAPDTIVMRPAASTAVRMAQSLANATVGQKKFDARHLIVAALDCPDPAAAAQMHQDSRAVGLDLDALRENLLTRILENPERNEKLAVWESLRTDRKRAWAAISATHQAALRQAAATVAGFQADRVGGMESDPLGIQADVSAFARLMCLEEATPPLSIGLFGEWGSGKSSFMERLQGEIASLTRKEREARKNAAEAAKAAPANAPATARPPAPRFVENVVQIRFNAWHYADANLWASLTAEFFDQLRRGGHAGQRSSDYLALIGKVADRVRSLEAGVKLADGALAAAAMAAKQADKALSEAREKLAASDLAVASEHLGAELKAFQKENAASLKEVGTRVYRTDLSTDIDGLTAAVSEASSIPGKIALVSRVLASGGAATWLAAAAVVLVAAAGLGWRAGDPASLAVLVQRMIAWGSGALAALGALWQATASVRPVLDGAWRYAKAVEAARKQLAKDVADREREANDAKKKLAEAEEASQKAKAPLAQYGDGATAGAPGTILRYFLFEDSDVRDYDKQVGLVSRARRSFEQLDAIFSAARDGRAAKEKQARGEALSEAETRALKQFEAMAIDEKGVKIPDRIVLYIDDLDRCTHAQVFDVLQAIHLLLAFELFVVVVGVDVRWVEEAVARQFASNVIDLPDNATVAEREAAQKRRETEQRKRAIDYLEKIFQLPFWLRRLSTEGDRGGSYGAYVKDLLKANLDVAENTPSPLAPLKVAAKKSFAAPGGTEAGEVLDNLVAPDDEAVPEAEELASIELALATVRLTQAEVDFLASPELGAIAFKSPRAVKRMLNIYRIVRARMDEAELDAFLGRAGKPPTWPIAAFMAAIETGQPVEVADKIYDALRSESEESTFTLDFIRSFFRKDADPDTIPIDTVLAEGNRIRAMHAAITAALERCGVGTGREPPPTFGTMLAMARTVRRYSFNRVH
jgi:hypothetical protein